MGRKKTALVNSFLNYSSSQRFRLEIRKSQIENTFKELRGERFIRNKPQNPEPDIQDIQNIPYNKKAPIAEKSRNENMNLTKNQNYHQILSGNQFPNYVGYNAPTKLFPQVGACYHINNNVYNYGHIQNAQCGQKIVQQPYYRANAGSKSYEQILYKNNHYKNNVHEIAIRQNNNINIVYNVGNNYVQNPIKIPSVQEKICLKMPININKQSPEQTPNSILNQFKNQKVYIKFQNYVVFNKILGSGSYSKVYLGLQKATQTKVAVKEVSELEENQIKCLMSVDSPYVIKLRSYWKDATSKMTYLVLDFCKNNLRQQLKQCEKSKALKYYDDIVKGIDALMAKKLVHRDLKFQNILISLEGVAKITDFGLAKDLGNMSNIASLRCGTPYTMAPEILFHNGYGRARYSHKCDIWSMGVILHEILYRKHPFNYDSQKVHRMQRVSIPRDNGLYDKLIDRSLVKDPEQRINWSQFYNLYQLIMSPPKLHNNPQINQKRNQKSANTMNVGYNNQKKQVSADNWNQRNLFKRKKEPIELSQQIQKHRFLKMNKPRHKDINMCDAKERQFNNHQYHKKKISEMIESMQLQNPLVCEHEHKQRKAKQSQQQKIKKNKNKQNGANATRTQLDSEQISRFQNFRLMRHVRLGCSKNQKQASIMNNNVNILQPDKQQTNLQKQQIYREKRISTAYFPPPTKQTRNITFSPPPQQNIFFNGMSACLFVFLLLFIFGKILGV